MQHNDIAPFGCSWQTRRAIDMLHYYLRTINTIARHAKKAAEDPFFTGTRAEDIKKALKALLLASRDLRTATSFDSTAGDTRSCAH